MKKNPSTRSAFFNLRSLFGFTLGFLGIALAIFAHFSPLTDHVSRPGAANAPRYMAVPGARPDTEATDLGRLEQFWTDRLTYPTGRFDPAWLRAAAAQHARLSVGVPAGIPALLNPKSPLAFTGTGFVGLGPKPERMTGCSGCFDETARRRQV